VQDGGGWYNVDGGKEGKMAALEANGREINKYLLTHLSVSLTADEWLRYASPELPSATSLVRILLYAIGYYRYLKGTDLERATGQFH
jgi:hypothetical protein